MPVSSLLEALADVDSHSHQLLLLLPIVTSRPQQCLSLCAALAAAGTTQDLVGTLLALCDSRRAATSDARLPQLAAKVDSPAAAAARPAKQAMLTSVTCDVWREDSCWMPS